VAPPDGGVPVVPIGAGGGISPAPNRPPPAGGGVPPAPAGAGGGEVAAKVPAGGGDPPAPAGPGGGELKRPAGGGDLPAPAGGGEPPGAPSGAAPGAALGAPPPPGVSEFSVSPIRQLGAAVRNAGPHLQQCVLEHYFTFVHLQELAIANKAA
jgi:hypothetical protein